MDKEKVLKWFGKQWGLFENTMFPEYKCICCGEELQDLKERICPDCMAEIDFHEGKVCSKCGAEIDPEFGVCQSCGTFHNVFNFDQAMSVCEYGEVSGRLVKSLKYNGNKYVAKHLARFMADTYLKSNEYADVVTFVPQNLRAEKVRGFNHAELIAQSFSKITNLKMQSTLLRIKDTPNQASLPRSARKTNLVDAFDVEKGLDLRKKTVILIDDVFTTGSTASECARMLRKAHPRKIVVLTFAKTSDPNSLGA